MDEDEKFEISTEDIAMGMVLDAASDSFQIYKSVIDQLAKMVCNSAVDEINLDDVEEVLNTIGKSVSDYMVY
jgi:hypothetical protein